jgi:hypothetical protein
MDVFDLSTITYAHQSEGEPSMSETPEENISETELADELKEQLDVFTEGAGNDIFGFHVTEATANGRQVNVHFDNGQRFRIQVEEL